MERLVLIGLCIIIILLAFIVLIIIKGLDHYTDRTEVIITLLDQIDSLIRNK